MNILPKPLMDQWQEYNWQYLTQKPSQDVFECLHAPTLCWKTFDNRYTSCCCAAIFSFLSAVSETRRCGIIRREPLNVTLIGAEFSEPARVLYQEMLSRLKPSLDEQAISLEAMFLYWDATSDHSNTQSIKMMKTVSTIVP
jgi:hypothetical protein